MKKLLLFIFILNFKISWAGDPYVGNPSFKNLNGDIVSASNLLGNTNYILEIPTGVSPLNGSMEIGSYKITINLGSGLTPNASFEQIDANYYWNYDEQVNVLYGTLKVKALAGFVNNFGSILKINVLTKNSNIQSNLQPQINLINIDATDLEANNYATVNYSIQTSKLTTATDVFLFNVIKKNKSAIISWDVTNEANIDNYIVQRKINDNNWETYTIVNAYNNATRYVYKTDDINLKSGTYTYRLIKNFINSRIEITNEISVIINDENLMISILPNPVIDKAFIMLPESFSNAIVNIMDANGKKILTNNLKNNLQRSFYMNKLPSGTYTIMAINDDGTILNKNFIKTN